MKQVTIQISHASPAQLLTIATELKIMSNEWTKFGPRILVDGEKLQAPKLRISKEEEASRKRQAPSATKRPQLNDIKKLERNNAKKRS